MGGKRRACGCVSPPPLVGERRLGRRPATMGAAGHSGAAAPGRTAPAVISRRERRRFCERQAWPPAAREVARRSAVDPALLRLCGRRGRALRDDACRFRQDAAESGVLEACLDEVNRQLAAKGLMLKTGTLIDATIIAAKSRKPEPAQGLGRKFLRARRRLDEEERPLPFRLSPPCRRRRGLGLIRRLVLTPARVNGSLVADDSAAATSAPSMATRATRARSAAPGSRRAASRFASCTARPRTRPPCPRSAAERRRRGPRRPCPLQPGSRERRGRLHAEAAPPCAPSATAPP